MSNLRTIKLTPAQLSAIVCSGLLDAAGDNTPDEDVLRLSIVGGDKLVVSSNTRDTIARVVCELSNAEDEFARMHKGEIPMSLLAARASLALSNLMRKVSRLKFEDVTT